MEKAKFGKKDRELFRNVLRKHCLDCPCWNDREGGCTIEPECSVERCLRIVDGIYKALGGDDGH